MYVRVVKNSKNLFIVMVCQVHVLVDLWVPYIVQSLFFIIYSFSIVYQFFIIYFMIFLFYFYSFSFLSKVPFLKNCASYVVFYFLFVLYFWFMLYMNKEIFHSLLFCYFIVYILYHWVILNSGFKVQILDFWSGFVGSIFIL